MKVELIPEIIQSQNAWVATYPDYSVVGKGSTEEEAINNLEEHFRYMVKSGECPNINIPKEYKNLSLDQVFFGSHDTIKSLFFIWSHDSGFGEFVISEQSGKIIVDDECMSSEFLLELFKKFLSSVSKR